MKKIIQQEILLMTGTSFSSRQCWQKNEDGQKCLSEIELLQEACWNGLLKQMLPEICKHSDENKRLYLWQVKENKSCLEIELSELPEQFDKNFSIDPYSFMLLKLMN